MKKDPSGTLKQLAAMGYKHVEHANYIDHKFYGYTQPEFKKLLDGLGLKMPSGHTRMNAEHWDAAKKDFTDDWKLTVADAAAMGSNMLSVPGWTRVCAKIMMTWYGTWKCSISVVNYAKNRG